MIKKGLFGDGYCGFGALNLACAADDTLILSNNYRFCFPTLLLKFEDSYWASVNARAFTGAFLQVNYYFYHSKDFLQVLIDFCYSH